MGLPNYPRPAFGPSGLGLRFGLAQRGLDIALGAPLLWAWRVGLRAHFSNPITSNITRGGSNRGRGSVKRSREKWLMDHFFTPNAEAVVQNRSGKMTQTTMNDAYKKEARERACSLISRWMYDAAIPFNLITYPSFQ